MLFLPGRVIYVLPKEKEENRMEIMSLVTDRRKLIAAIEELSSKMKYQGPPTFSYKNEVATVLRDGTLVIEDLEGNKELLLQLANQKLIDDSWNEDREVLCISLPLEQHTAQSLINLVSIFYTKATIINKAIGAPRAFEINERFIETIMEEQPTEVSEFLSFWKECGSDNMTKGINFYEGKINFTGFPVTENSNWVKAFTEIASAINKLALESKYIKINPEPIENEKYSFRVWLVRIGFVGTEHKTSRKLLLSNLSGHTAFRTESQKEAHKQKYLVKKAEFTNEES